MVIGGEVECWKSCCAGATAPLHGITDAVDVSVGRNHACVLHVSGRVSCWGENRYGQLGNRAAADPSDLPVEVTGLEDAVYLEVGTDGSCVVRADARVACWGRNTYGQLGDGSTDDRFVATPVFGLSDAVAVATGPTHTCAVRSAGDVWCWGENRYGQLGDGSMSTTSLEPVRVAGLDDAVGVAVYTDISGAVRRAGEVVLWGNFEIEVVRRLTPTPLEGVSDAASVELGLEHGCFLRRDGTVGCWGNNREGQLGDGTYDVSIGPRPVVDLVGVAEIAVGPVHACALHATGVSCWGAISRPPLAEESTPRPLPIDGIR
ncbi:MAG: hypothetical protein IT379_04190 [Deltaproteobacteria bacterium]|nr:hypothetical protein [Deltaproteobacteria bacterium]